MKIIFCAESDYFVDVFISLLESIPDVDSLFLGYYWASGLKLRKKGFKYLHIPFWDRSVKCQNIPPTIEVKGRGFSTKNAPNCVKNAIGSCEKFIDTLLGNYQPDLVVYGCAELVISYILDETAARKRIPRLGLQTSFVAGKFIVHEGGGQWTKIIQALEIREVLNPKPYSPSNVRTPITLRKVQRTHSWNLNRVTRLAERVWRFTTLGVTFDTSWALGVQIYMKLFMCRWFPGFNTLTTLEDIGDDFLLVALNHPWLETDLTPIDLIEFALEAAPKNLQIILRPHPNEPPPKISKNTLKSLHARNVFISRSGYGPELGTLVSKCKALLTMNSAVGIEALMLGKPVFTMAAAIYARPGLTTQVSPKDTIAVHNSLESSTLQKPDPFEVARFCLWLIQDHMVSYPDPGLPGGDELIGRIRAMDPASTRACHQTSHRIAEAK